MDVRNEMHIIHSRYAAGWDKILVPSSWEWRTPFNLPGKAVMRWQASSLSPGKFQAHCKFFVECSRWVGWNISEVINENSTSAFNYLNDFSYGLLTVLAYAAVSKDMLALLLNENKRSDRNAFEEDIHTLIQLSGLQAIFLTCLQEGVPVLLKKSTLTTFWYFVKCVSKTEGTQVLGHYKWQNCSNKEKYLLPEPSAEQDSR